MSREFTQLPPHFAHGDLASEAWSWNDILPNYETNYPQEFKQVIPYLLASLVYHRIWLKDTLPVCHPFFTSRVWTSGKLDELASKVETGYMRNERTGMSASGIPPHIITLDKLEEVIAELAGVKQTIIQVSDEMPNKLAERILENFNIDGVVPMSRTDMEQMLAAVKGSLQETMQTLITNHLPRHAAAENPVNIPNQLRRYHGGQVQNDQFRWWMWGGAFHKVPANFQLPLCDCRAFFDLWIKGNHMENISPYHKIDGSDLRCTNHDNDEANSKETRRWRNVLTKAKKVMSVLVEIILILNRNNPHPNPEIHDIKSLYQLSYSDLDEVFKLAHEDLMSRLYPQFTAEQRNSRLINDMSYVTVYDRLISYNM